MITNLDRTIELTQSSNLYALDRLKEIMVKKGDFNNRAIILQGYGKQLDSALSYISTALKVVK